MRDIWFYASQRLAVQEWLLHRFNIPRQLLVSVDLQTMHRLSGIEDGVFVHIANHYDVVPQPLWEMLSTRGFTIIVIDDSNNRRRYEERHGRR